MSASVDGARGRNDEHASGMSFPPPAHQAIFGVATMRRSPDIYISQDYEGVGKCEVHLTGLQLIAPYRYLGN